MANQLENYALGQWTKGSSEGQMLYNAITGEEIATASSAGLDFGAMMDYARTVGGPKLRKMTPIVMLNMFQLLIQIIST